MLYWNGRRQGAYGVDRSKGTTSSDYVPLANVHVIYPSNQTPVAQPQTRPPNRQGKSHAHQQQQKTERKIQEAVRQHEKQMETRMHDSVQRLEREMESRLQEVTKQQQEAERRAQTALRLQEERASAALREVERKLQEKDDAIRTLQQRLEETQERVTAVEERRTAPEGSGGGVQRLEGRVQEVEAALQRATTKFFPRVEALLCQLEEEPTSPTVAAAAASSPSAKATEAGGRGGIRPARPPRPPLVVTLPPSPQSAAPADEEARERQRVELRAREVAARVRRAKTPASSLGEQLGTAAAKGSLCDVQRLVGSGADVNAPDAGGFSPLHRAAYPRAHADVVSFLLRRGADANAVDVCGKSALQLAALCDPTGRCVHLLVEAGGDANARNARGETPLHWAAKYGMKQAARALLAAGARKDLRPWDGEWKHKTPFDVASSPDLRDLLRQNDNRVNLADKECDLIGSLCDNIIWEV